MGFAREVANRIVFMDAGQIIESNTPENFFANPQHARSKLLSSRRRFYGPNRVRQDRQFADDGDKTNSSPGSAE